MTEATVNTDAATGGLPTGAPPPVTAEQFAWTGKDQYNRPIKLSEEQIKKLASIPEKHRGRAIMELLRQREHHLSLQDAKLARIAQRRKRAKIQRANRKRNR